MLSQWALNMGPQPFMSNTVLSELSRHLLLGISLNCLLFLHHLILNLDHLVRTNGEWSYKNLTDLLSNTCLNNSERRASDPNCCGTRFNANRGNILSQWLEYCHCCQFWLFCEKLEIYYCPHLNVLSGLGFCRIHTVHKREPLVSINFRLMRKIKSRHWNWQLKLIWWIDLVRCYSYRSKTNIQIEGQRGYSA